MRFIYLFILCFLFVLNFHEGAYAEGSTEKTPVRGFIWGLPTDVIKGNEHGQYVDTQEFDGQNKALFFVDRIRGMRASIAYEFHDNKLWQVRIFIDKKYFDPQDRMADLLTIHADLTKRFGAPTDEQMSWTDSREKNFPDSWGWAIFRQELIMSSTWQDGETQVSTYVGAKEKYNPIMSVTYTHAPTKIELEQKEQNQELWAP